jgi:hypothetical protein
MSKLDRLVENRLKVMDKLLKEAGPSGAMYWFGDNLPEEIKRMADDVAWCKIAISRGLAGRATYGEDVGKAMRILTSVGGALERLSNNLATKGINDLNT